MKQKIIYFVLLVAGTYLPASSNEYAKIVQTVITENEMQVKEKETIFSHNDPEFPGGMEALSRFFYRNLNAPDELSAGEKKKVQVKFQINNEGIVSGLEIESREKTPLREELTESDHCFPSENPQIGCRFRG